MNEISTAQIFGAILRSIWIAIIVAIAFGIVAFSYVNMFMEDVYRARSSIFITNGGIISAESEDTTIKSSDFTASFQLLPSCVDILSTAEAKKKLAEQLNNEVAINGALSISIRSEDSLFIDFRYSTHSKEEAIKVANALADMAPQYLKSFFNNSISVKNVEYATTASKVAPRTATITVTAAFIGGILVFGIAALLAVLDQTIKGENDIVTHYEVPILGIVPDFEVLKK